MQIRLTDEASENLDQIRSYIADGSAEAATRVVRELIAAVDSLAVLPNRGRPGRRDGTRELVLGRYIIVYRVFEAHVEVTYVRHHAQRR